MLNFIRKFFNKSTEVEEHKPSKFVRCRCPKCNSLLYEKEENSYQESSVRIKCRMCKEIMVL